MEKNQTPICSNTKLCTVISNEDICKRKCLDCGYVGCDLAKDSCAKCGYRYEPSKENENCPNCDCEDYDSHCPECDSNNIVYYNEYKIMIAEKVCLAEMPNLKKIV